MQETEAGSDVLTPLRRSRDFLYNTQTQASALIPTNCLDNSVFYMCGSAFSAGGIYFLYSNYFVWQTLHEASSPAPLARCESDSSYWILPTFCRLYSRGPGGDSPFSASRLWTFAFSHTAPPNVRRLSRVYCMSENSLSLGHFKDEFLSTKIC